MAESRVLPQHPFFMRRTHLVGKPRLLRLSLLSALVHGIALTTLLVWTGGRAKLSPPVRVITIDLTQSDLPEKTAQQHTRPKAISARPPLPAPSAPVTPRTSPEPPATSPSPVMPVAPAAQTVTAKTATVPSVMKGRTVTTGPTEGALTARPDATVPTSPITAPAPPRVRSAGGGAEASSLRAGYMQLCRGLIERHKEYPVMARRGRVQGTVVVRGTLARDGSLRQCTVNLTSGSSLLDKAAVRAVQSVGRFPPVPAELPGEELVLEVPISFTLNVD